MQASQALALERFLEGQELAKKPAMLLKGLGAKLVRASDLPASQSGLPAPAPDERFLESLILSLPAHTLIEVVGRRSSGRFSIGLAAMASSTASGESAALVDLGDNLDPQEAERAGIDLARVLWVRPRRVKEALSAAEMLLATGFRLVVADLGLSPRGGRFVPDAAWVRLQRAARSQESTLLLLVPYRMSGIAADLVVSARAARPFWQGKGPAPRLLTGIASHLILEKRGRETPGRSASLSLFTPEAITLDRETCDSPGLQRGRSLRDRRCEFSKPEPGPLVPAPQLSVSSFRPDQKLQITNHKSSLLTPNSQLAFRDGSRCASAAENFLNPKQSKSLIPAHSG